MDVLFVEKVTIQETWNRYGKDRKWGMIFIPDSRRM